MTAKGAWGLVIAGVLGLGSLIGAPIADSLVKEGKLPDWISGKLAGLLEFLSQQVQFTLWAFTIGMVIACGVIVTLCRVAFAASDQDGHIARLKDECEKREQRYLASEEQKVLLMEQLVEKTQALEAMEALEAQRAIEAPEAIEVSLIGRRVLKIIARCTDMEMRPTLSMISGPLSIGNVEAHAALDVLIEQQLVARSVNTRATTFRLTPKGRAYYVGQKEQS